MGFFWLCPCGHENFYKGDKGKRAITTCPFCKLKCRIYQYKIEKNSKLPQDFYFSDVWKEMRIRILTRDNFKCRINSPKCTYVATIIHHLNSARFSPKLALDPENLIAVCYNCHELTKRREHK